MLRVSRYNETAPSIADIFLRRIKLVSYVIYREKRTSPNIAKTRLSLNNSTATTNAINAPNIYGPKKPKSTPELVNAKATRDIPRKIPMTPLMDLSMTSCDTTPLRDWSNRPWMTANTVKRAIFMAGGIGMKPMINISAIDKTKYTMSEYLNDTRGALANTP